LTFFKIGFVSHILFFLIEFFLSAQKISASVFASAFAEATARQASYDGQVRLNLMTQYLKSKKLQKPYGGILKFPVC